MNKKLIRNLAEYRKWAWEVSDGCLNGDIAECLGLIPVNEYCATSIKDDGIVIILDENGNVIPEDTEETIKLDETISKLIFPVIVIYYFSETKTHWAGWRPCQCVFVSLIEFSEPLDNSLENDTSDKDPV
jgi:hypothetical protein